MSQISKTFAHHTPTDEGLGKIRTLRKAFTELESAIWSLVPNTRERSVALTNLETAAMWAIKALVVNDPGSKAEYDPTAL